MSADSVDYKIVELMTVTDESMQITINELTRQGWMFEDVKFAMREASKRPSMAFLFFTRVRREGQGRESLSVVREAPRPLPPEDEPA